MTEKKASIELEDVLLYGGSIAIGVGIGFGLGWYWGLVAVGLIFVVMAFWMLAIAARFPPRK
jgi:ABC-type antimicrobial peptide transport system permease subunit